MNLELIKKYEKEFLHMLHGGTILSRVLTSDEDDETYTIWYEVNACNNMEKWSSDYLFNLSDIKCEYYKPQFIINDEYVEFRKALTEGKTVQFKSLIIQTWCTAQLSHTFGNIPVSSYRIKPEEPELKVGDTIILECVDSDKGLYKLK